ncbi:HEAT repeat-containing protein 1 isoform X2 [Electrophorus electricus]|uniref:HEAT repeat-containing protein 1 isoform X2 n=1 Tax=Electrophorus electricus TaxID=8005 RepID=UPI0015D04AD8|nr:HEAT repeat-containing protein 1 isoform X2 [Electrophorus electricus]
MTSLAHQLKRLALPQNEPSLLSRRETASVLFEPKDAASMDGSTFHALGCTGLEELLGIEPAFAEFQQTLFSQASLSMERSVQDRAVNKQLDKGISLFLARLSPYFLLKPALKCLEWLIHRFHIHLYNQDSLIACVLPYHETKVFVRVIQLLKIDDPTHRWHWLHGLQKPGVPLARGTLLTHCYKDLSFMDFVCTLVTKSVKAYSGAVRDGQCLQLRVVFSFYAAAIVPSLEAVEKVTDSVIAKLLPYVHLGLKSELVDYKAATYMIVAQLAVKVVMQAELADSLAVQVSRSLGRVPVLASEGLACLIILLQNQKEATLGPKTFGYLCAVPTLVPTLQSIAASYDISPLLHYLLPQLVHSVFACHDELQDERSDGSAHGRLLESVLQTLPLNSDLEATVGRLLFDGYVSAGTELSSNGLATLNGKMQPIVRLFECKCPTALDAIFEGHMSAQRSEQQKKLLHHFLSLTMSCGKYQVLPDSDTSLLLSLNHPLSSVRNMAVDYLKEVLISGKGFDEAFLKDALLERLKDDDPEVVMSAVSALQLYADHVDPENTASCLISVLQRIQSPAIGQWYLVLEEVVRMLDDPRLTAGSPDLCTRIGWKLLPFLLVTNPAAESPELQLALCVSKTHLLSQHPLTRGWANALGVVLQNTAPADVVGEASQAFTGTLTKNLACMEPSARRNAIESVCSLLARTAATVRDRAAFVVLSGALLQALGTLSESQHLHTAQTLLGLLEPALRTLATLVEEEEEEEEEEQLCGVPEGQSPSTDALLASFLSKLHAGLCATREQGLVLLSLLHHFISALKCPEPTFKEEPWWNPEKLDASTCCYLQLLCRLLDMVVGGANRGPLAPSFRALLQPLLQVHLQATEHLFRFLPLLWVYGSNLGDQLEFRVTPLLQARALYVGRALLVSVPAGSREALASASSPVVPSLLACLGCAVAEVRRAALAVLQLLAGTTASPYCPLVEKLLSAAEELISDPSYLSQALGRLYEEAMSSGKSGTRLLAAVEQLLRCVQSPDCPCYVATVLLQALRDVNGEFVLSTLLPAMERLLEQRASDAAPLLPDEALLLSLLLGKYTASAAPLLTRHPRSLELFLTALGTSSAPRPGITSLQVVAAEQITKPFFAALADEKVQQRILGVLFDVLVDTKDPACSQTLSSVFKGITVDAELVSNELTPTNKPRVSASVQQTRRSKLQLKKALDATPEEGAVSWPRVTLILELLQHKKKLRRPQMLVPTLFNLLARCLEASLEQENMEYTKQLLLSVLLNVCQKLSPHGGAVSKDVLDEDKFSVELVVQCVRTSVVPQTHHHALLLLSTVAGIFPEKVLHNVMAIFTFMGANVMRLDDSYSLQVISRTVQAVIPALIRAHEGASASSQAATEAAVTRLLRVFVDALPHVPEHRRLPVLHQLLSALGPARFLWVLLLLLFEQHTGTSSSRAASEKEAALEQDQEFWVSVCCEFEVQEQLTSFIKILQFLMALPKDKEQVPERKGARAGKREESVADLIFSVEAHSGKELRHFKFLALSFMGQLLASGGFVGKVVDCADLTGHALQELQQSLLEETLRYIHAVALCVEQNSEQPTAKFWRALLTKSYDILDKVNALLPMDTFITVVRGLMGNQLPSVRRKALELLNNRLQHRTQWEEPQVAMLLELIGDLLSIVDRHRAQASCQEEEEQAINRQTALYGLKLMCRSFGAGHQEAFLPVLSRTVELVANPEEERNVMGSALLCVAEVTSTLKALAIPQIHRLMPAVLQALKERKELLSNEVYLLSAVTALQKTAETLPHFISPYLEGTVSQVSRLTRVAERLPSCPQLTARLASLSSTLATKVSSRVLLPTITRCYSSMVDSQKSRLGPLLNILKEHIGHMEKDQLASHQSELSSFFLSALDYRAKHCQGNLEKTAEIEGYVIDCLLVMVMKLSEVTFRPLFFKLFNWSKTEGASKERMLTFCRLADRLADKLKGLFVLFAGQLVKPFSDLLRQLNATLTDDVFFTSENDDDDIDNDGEESNVQKSCLLLEYMLDCLHKIFLYDTQRFLSKERADALLGSLVDQLENVLGGEDVYQTRVIKHLVPCIAQFAVAMGDDSHWKVLNYKILLKTRHSSPKVRFSALVMILELAGKLKENYMVLLPETVPFLAELMEDECEEVEYHVQNVIQEMETILGESLQSYF